MRRGDSVWNTRITEKQSGELFDAASEIAPTVTVSMDIAVASGKTYSSDMVAAANAALYRAKRQGRNRWLF